MYIYICLKTRGMFSFYTYHASLRITHWGGFKCTENLEIYFDKLRQFNFEVHNVLNFLFGSLWTRAEQETIKSLMQCWLLKLRLKKIIYFNWRIMTLRYCDAFCHTSTWINFPGSSVDKESACSAGDQGSIPGLGRSPRVGNGNPHQYCLENLMDRGAWWAAVWGCKSRTWLSN